MCVLSVACTQLSSEELMGVEGSYRGDLMTCHRGVGGYS